MVRDGDMLDFLSDGQAMTGAVTEIAGLAGFRLAASPVIETDVAFPATRADRWPAVPATTEPPQELTADLSSRARTEMTAAYVGTGPDVVVTWPAGSLPAEAHVRIFPRVDPGPAIVPLAELDFARRGEGAAGIAKAAGLALLVRDPFRVRTGTPPATPILRFDLVIVTRAGAVRGRLMGGLEAGVGTGATAPAESAVTNLLNGMPLDQCGISPSPVIGLPPTAPATGSDPVLAAWVRLPHGESPRFRTMARLDSIMAGHDGGTPGVWQAVNTPGFFSGRSVRGDADFGNPGNPAGPEDHAPVRARPVGWASTWPARPYAVPTIWSHACLCSTMRAGAFRLSAAVTLPVQFCRMWRRPSKARNWIWCRSRWSTLCPVTGAT